MESSGPLMSAGFDSESRAAVDLHQPGTVAAPDDHGDEDPALFNPTAFDANEIAGALKAGGCACGRISGWDRGWRGLQWINGIRARGKPSPRVPAWVLAVCFPFRKS
jgi:hypothetical protein